MPFQLEAIVWRGAIAESRHQLEAAVCDASGRRIAATAGAGSVTTFRSAAKPFQLLPLVERGHADRYGFGPADLAVMAASHTGSAAHLERVQAILDTIGLDASHLACGFHEPLDPASLARVRAGAEPSRLYNNCSGKHAGFLALCLAEGWPIEGYERATHPLQQLLRRTVAECCGMATDDVAVAVDGCSVSVFGLPLAAMARGYAVLAAAAPAAAQPREAALARIRAAMLAHPVMTGGEGRLSTEVMRATGGRALAKGGAEGLECVALPGRGLGIAIKCADGAARALGPAVISVLEGLGERELAATLETWRRPKVHNYAGLEVGHVEVATRVGQPAGAPL